MWFSTQDGLNKFDGTSVIQFSKTNLNSSKQLLGSDCWGMHYNKNEDYLYILFPYEGLDIINVNTNKIFNKIPASILTNSKENVWLKKIIRYKDNLLIPTDKNELIVFNTITQKVQKRKKLEQHTNGNLNDIFIYENLIGIIISGIGIDYYDAKSLVFIKHKPFKKIVLKKTYINNICIANNLIWFATDNGIFIENINDTKNKNNDKFEIENSLTNIFYTPTKQIFYDNKKTIIISNLNGTYIYNLLTNSLRKFENYKIGENLQFLKQVNSIYVKNNLLWLGSANGVANVNYDVSIFNAVYKNSINNNIKLDHVFNLFKNDDDKIMVADENGFFKVNNKNGIIKNIINNQTVYAFCNINNNQTLISGTKQLLFVENDIIKPLTNKYNELRKLKNELFCSIKKVNDSIIMLVSEKETGIHIWNLKAKTLKNLNTKSKLKIDDLLINNLFILNKDTVFIISETSIQLLQYNKNIIQSIFNKQNLVPHKADVFMDMCSQKNSYWIAAYGLGIVKLNGKFELEKVYSTKEGLANIGLYKIFNVDDSLIVATSNNGLIVLNTKTNIVNNYFEADGLHSSAFEETSGYQQGDSIYAGGIKGFTIFNTKNYKTNTTKPLFYFTNITIATSNKSYDTTNLFLQKLKIPNNATQTKISFVGLNYQNPTRVTYWYKIKQINNEWISLGTQNFIDLIGLEPGKYELQVKAANEDGVECLPKMITLHFLPKWYQTLLFKILVALTIIGILWLLYSFRIRQLKKIIAVRQKISSDLHDDIGSTLSSINMYSQVAQLQPYNPTHTVAIQENTRDVLEKLDDIVWATNPKNDQVKNLIERMDSFAKPLLQANSILFNFTPSPKIDTLTLQETTRQNLFLIFKEAINNTCKYAKANNCTLTLLAKNKTLHCTIADDGIGFDATIPTQRNGLLNMQQRVAQLKGKIVLESTIAVGTTITIQLPI